MMQQMMPQMMQMMEKKAEEKMPAAKKELSTAGRLEMIPAMLAGGMAMPPAKMRRLMDHTFYLDRIPQLGLTAQQVEKLRAIRAACRRDNIRAAAELRLARLELEDLLEGEWTVEAAEKAVRTVRKLEGDIQVRHLKAVKEAQKVLTPEQLSQAAEDQEPEELFR
jgi:Spy/CpxP family protein refolding chaperone